MVRSSCFWVIYLNSPRHGALYQTYILITRCFYSSFSVCVFWIRIIFSFWIAFSFCVDSIESIMDIKMKC
eukprot:UN00778